MSSYGLTHLPLSHPWRSTSFLPLVTSSVLTSGATLSANFCRVKRCFKPYQNEHNSVKDTGGKGQKPCNIDLKILSRFSFAAKVFGHASHSTELVRRYMCLACQHFAFNRADWISDNLHVITSWYLRTMGKELIFRFSRRSWGRNAWRTTKNVCVGGYRSKELEDVGRVASSFPTHLGKIEATLLAGYW